VSVRFGSGEWRIASYRVGPRRWFRWLEGKPENSMERFAAYVEAGDNRAAMVAAAIEALEDERKSYSFLVIVENDQVTLGDSFLSVNGENTSPREFLVRARKLLDEAERRYPT
jgi:hypothetical protein